MGLCLSFYRVFAGDRRQTTFYPTKQGLVSLCNSEADGRLQLAHTDRAEVEGPAVRFLEVVGPLHHATQPLTMLEPKNVTNLMSQCLAGAIQQCAGYGRGVAATEQGVVPGSQLLGILQPAFVVSAVKIVIISGKTEDTHPFS